MPASTAPPQTCLLNWGRLGATRLNYVSTFLFGSIGGVPLDPTHQSILIESLSVSDRLNEDPNTLIATVRGTKPREGQAITLTYGSLNNLPLFAGTILRVTQVWAADNPKYILCHIEATDPTWRLNEILVTARYRSQSATLTAASLLARFAPAGYTGAIEANLPALDEITFTNTKLMDALVQLASRIGGHAYCDYRSVVHLFMATEPVIAPTPLTASHPSVAAVQYTRDLTQLVTRAIVQGGGANALARLPPGSTEIPIEDAAWYSASGGLVVSGPQRIRYTGTRAGGGGALVGSGAAPTSAPAMAIAAGGSVTVGVHYYGYTWVSPLGESVASPFGPYVTISSNVPTAVAPGVKVSVGTGLPPGTYLYAAADVLPSGETAWAQAGQNAVCTRFFGTAYGAPGLRPWVTLTTNLGAIGDQMEARLAYRSTTALSPATLGPTSARVTLVASTTGPPCGLEVSFNLSSLPYSANYLDVQVRNVTTGGAWGTVKTYSNVGGGGISAGCYVGVVTATTAATETGGLDTASVQITIVAGPAGTLSRRVYRTKVNATTLYLVETIPGAAQTTFLDTTPDSALVTRPPAGTGALQTVTISGIAPGPRGAGGGPATTARKLYRSLANTASYQLVATIPDNTTTTYTDTVDDAALTPGAPPATDTSGLVADAGQVLPGAPTLPVSGTGAFPPAGGWVLSGNNRIHYAAVGASALTGIPATGDGSIQNTVPYGTPVTLAPCLTGIPAVGSGAIVWAILAGDPVDLLVIVDDLNAQATLQALLGGGATGIREALIQDGRIGITEATARGTALLQLQSRVLETLRHRSRDPNTASGALVTIDLPAPTAIAGTFRIQDVTVSSFNPHAGIYPTYDAQSSSSRYTLEDLLRQLTRTDPPPATGETP